VTTLAPFVVHVASAPVGATQSCAACDFVLTDNSAWFEGRVAVPAGDDSRGPSWWPNGAQVATDKTATSRGGMTYLVDDRPLDDDERYCAGAN